MIKELWLISKEGLLIHHGIIKKSIPIDPDLIGALMSALQSFSEELTGKQINYVDIAGDERIIYIPILKNQYFIVARTEFFLGERVFSTEIEKFRFIVGSVFSQFSETELDKINLRDTNRMAIYLLEPFNQILELLRDFALREEERLDKVNIDVTQHLDYFHRIGEKIPKERYSLFVLDRENNIILFQRVSETIGFRDHDFLLRILNELKFSLLIKENLNKIAFTNGLMEVLVNYTKNFIYILITNCDNLNLTNQTNFPAMARIMIDIINEDAEYFQKSQY